jgi:hypothetical protein
MLRTPTAPLARCGRAITLCLLGAVLASWLSRALCGTPKVDDLQISALQRIGCGTLVGLGLAGAAVWFLKAWLTAARRPLAGLLPLALVMHAVCFAALPCTSNDIFANLAFGREMLVGLNPFHDVAADLGADPIVPYVGSTWMHWHTCYGPLTTMIDALAAWPSGVVIPMLLFKLVLLACSLVTVLLAYDFCRSCLSPKHAAQAFILLAWNPLLAWEVSGQAHNDGLLVLALTAFVWAASRKRQWLAAAALMAGLYLKFAALPVIGLYGLCVGRQRLGRSLLMGLALAAVGVVLYAPFWRGTATLAPALLASTASLDYLTNSLAAVIVAAGRLIDPQSGPALFWLVLLTSRIVLLVLAVGFALRARSVTRVVQDGLVFLLVFECLGMGWFQPWYATWLLPLAVACRSARLQWIVVVYTATISVIYLPYDGLYVPLIVVQTFPIVMLVRLWHARRAVKPVSFNPPALVGVS